MILDNLTRAFKTQNWFAVATEFVIVIAGVVIGFQIQAWNEGRSERAEEVHYLRALEDDIRLSRTSLEGMIANLAAQQSALEALYGVYLGEHEPGPQALAEWLNDGLFYLSALSVNETTFDTLVASGRLNILGDPELVAALQQLEGAYERVRVAIDNEYQVTYRFSDPLLIEHVDMGPVFNSDAGRNENIPWLGQSPPLELDAGALSERRFANAVLYRANFSGQTRRLVTGLISDLDAISAQIQVRIEAIDR
jgi:hypothetical protein